jgi:Peptidase family C25
MSINDKSIKLSVTVKRNLESKYKDPAVRKQIDDARQDWINADVKRDIHTIHIAVDDSADTNMKALGVRPIAGDVTPEKIKQVTDDLWKKITPTPHYLVLFGGHDIVPMFEVKNPTHDFKSDTDETVLTDNPYASYEPFSADDWHSYVVPDRVIGRIPDMLSDPDPGWFVDYLKTATKWKPKPASVYKRPYAICTDEAKIAGNDVMQEAFAKSNLPLLICPPTSDDASPPARARLSPRLHTIKCHGNEGDATFWGFLESDTKKAHKYPAITSATLRQLPHVARSTVVATMCCYGAQIFSPSDSKVKPRGAWPIASAYLRKGALGFVGPTKMAWVGLYDMSYADRIVATYLKKVVAGDSIGSAFLACKQDDPEKIGDSEAKTLIEYVLLGDPSIHPVISSQIAPGALAVQERRQRRVDRTIQATEIRESLPIRSPATPAEEAMAKYVFKSAQDMIPKDSVKKLKEFKIKPTAARVKRVNSRLPVLGPSERPQSLEYYWSGRRGRGEHKQVCLLRAETDRQGKVSRASVMYNS